MTPPPAAALELREEDLRLDVHSNASNVSYLTLRHIPTGLNVGTACGPGCEYVSQHKAKAALLDTLTKMVAEKAAREAPSVRGCRCPPDHQTEPHTCPYREEINHDDATLCTCCNGCRRECLYDI